MNVSQNWLKDYLKIDQSTEEICKILTSIGLEVGGYEEFEAIKGSSVPNPPASNIGPYMTEPK